MEQKGLISLIDEEFGDDLPDRPSAKFDLNFVLLRQVDRVNIAFSSGSEQVLTAVNALEGSLVGYIQKNKSYGSELKKLEDDYRQILDQAMKTQWSDSAKRKASFDFAQKKFALLMKIVYAYILGREKGGVIGKLGESSAEED